MKCVSRIQTSQSFFRLISKRNTPAAAHATWRIIGADTMIKIKHLMDAVEKDDGSRLWIEPFGLTKDFCEWCQVDHVLSHVGPPQHLWDWYEEHPDGYGYFRATYHE